MSDTLFTVDKAQNISLAELLKLSSKSLNASDKLDGEDGRSDSFLMFQQITAKTRSWIVVNEHKTVRDLISLEALTLFLDALKQRLSGVPVAYILGNQHFWSLDLEVNNSTLIPRQDTEVLIETALQLSLPKHSRVLDLGTGTGAIALALAKERKDWTVNGVDRVPKAVELATRNAKRNRLQASFYISHWYEIFEGSYKPNSSFPEIPNKFDLIVSNPPYVEPDSEYLLKGDLRFEPNSALVANNQGLADIVHIIEEAPKYLLNDGYLLLEHGFNQGEAVRNLLVENGFKHVKTINDYNQLPRVSVGRLQS